MTKKTHSPSRVNGGKPRTVSIDQLAHSLEYFKKRGVLPVSREDMLSALSVLNDVGSGKISRINWDKDRRFVLEDGDNGETEYRLADDMFLKSIPIINSLFDEKDYGRDVVMRLWELLTCPNRPGLVSSGHIRLGKDTFEMSDDLINAVCVMPMPTKGKVSTASILKAVKKVGGAK